MDQVFNFFLTAVWIYQMTAFFVFDVCRRCSHFVTWSS